MQPARASDYRLMEHPAGSPLRRSGVAGWVWSVTLFGLCVVLATPLFLVDVPPLLDYPNHLGRAFVLASLPQDAILARFYVPHWSIIPNLALDLVAPPMIKLWPVHVAGRLLIAAAVLLPVLGAIAYSRAPGTGAMGGRWWSFGVGLIAYNLCLLHGFLNFEISLGLALLLAAGWLRWRETRPASAIVLATLGAPVLFACHLMGLVFFALLIGGADLFRLYQNCTFAGAARRAAALALVFAAPAVLYGVSALRQLGGDAEFLPVKEKLLELGSPFVNYNPALDLTAGGAAIGLPVLCLLLRRGRVPGTAIVAVALLMIGFLVTPYAWKGTFALDTRFAIMLGFMLFAGFVPIRWSPGFGYIVAAAMVSLFAARMVLLTTAWVAHRSDIADIRAVLAPVQPGWVIYVAEAGLDEAPAYWAANPRWRLLSNGARMDEHLGALALMEHRAYWPFQFDVPSQQPIETREPFAGLAAGVGHLPTRDEAAKADLCGFEYVLLTAADAVPDLPADRFRLLIRSGYAALYAVTRCKPDQ